MTDPFSEKSIQKKLVSIRKNNLNEVKQAARTSEDWLMEKISSHIERWGGTSTVAAIKSKIQSDDEFAKFFAKDPQKQSFHEKYGQEEMINTGIPIVNLPNSGKNAIYIHNGSLKTNLSKKPEERIKSVDCRCQRISGSSTWEDYILQKWIGDSGGNQDNQFSDIRTFVEQANMYATTNKNNHRIIALVDGPYFSKDIMKQLRNAVDPGNKDRVKILSTYEYIKL